MRHTDQLGDVTDTQRPVRLREQQEQPDDVGIDTVLLCDESQPAVEARGEHQQPVGEDRDVGRVAVAPGPQVVVGGPAHRHGSRAADCGRPNRFGPEELVHAAQRASRVRHPNARPQISRFRVPF
jgi:hypothetical protein